MDDINLAKDNVKYVESAIDLTLQELPLPQELRHLDRGAIHALDRKVTKRLDMTLLPVVVLLFLLNILDRNNIANAKTVGLPKTLHITNEQYNNCLMIFYVGCKHSIS